MVFTSNIFLFYFLPLVLAAYYLLPKKRRNAFLTVASYVFYGWWQPWWVLLMFASTVLDYACGNAIATPGASELRRRTALTAAIVGDLGLLAFFKYYAFTVENINRLVGLFGGDSLPLLSIVLPIGISFYTFESMSYTIDVYRGHVRSVRRFSDLSCFVSLFPHLVAGPIVRYNVLAEQIHSRSHTAGKFTQGIALFILGLGKKILLANPMGTVADAVFGAAAPVSVDAWIGVIAYAFQIYFDFSGYSDMAIGLGRMFGFVIPRNFSSPYLAESITDFWRRWHISLSTWLRDYLYVPLGGNRKGPKRTYLNLALVMLLGGLWHGANWTFVAWGAYHGILLGLERWRLKTSFYDRLPRTGRVAMTFLLVLFSWVLFRSRDISHAAGYFAALFGANRADETSRLLGATTLEPYHVTIFALCIVFAFRRTEVYDWIEVLSWHKAFTLVVLLGVSISVMFTQAFNPFLYFQF